MFFDPRLGDVFVKHVEGCNAPDGSAVEAAAFKRRDELLSMLGVEGRADVLVVINAIRRLVCRSA